MRILHFAFKILELFYLDVFSLTLQTKDVVTISQEDNSIVLNCTYHKDAKEAISDRDIRWQKQIGDKFKDIAVFSPPIGPSPFVVKEMQPFYDNRTELIAPNSTLAAVLIIKDRSCILINFNVKCWLHCLFSKVVPYVPHIAILSHRIRFHLKVIALCCSVKYNVRHISI